MVRHQTKDSMSKNSIIDIAFRGSSLSVSIRIRNCGLLVVEVSEDHSV